MKEVFKKTEAYHTDEAAEVLEKSPLEDFVKIIYEDEIDRLRIFKKAIFQMASKRLNNVDDYIMIAKQAIADYEDRGGTYHDE